MAAPQRLARPDHPTGGGDFFPLRWPTPTPGVIFLFSIKKAPCLSDIAAEAGGGLKRPGTSDYLTQPIRVAELPVKLVTLTGSVLPVSDTV